MRNRIHLLLGEPAQNHPVLPADRHAILRSDAPRAPRFRQPASGCRL